MQPGKGAGHGNGMQRPHLCVDAGSGSGSCAAAAQQPQLFTATHPRLPSGQGVPGAAAAHCVFGIAHARGLPQVCAAVDVTRHTAAKALIAALSRPWPGAPWQSRNVAMP